MRWLKKYMWKMGIIIVGMLFFILMMQPSVSKASVYTAASGLATPGAVMAQATPTEDATVTVLNKEKLQQEVLQLKEQNEPDFLAWLRTNVSLLLSTLVVVIGGLIGLFRWLGDRRGAQDKELKSRQSEREKRAEERFQSAVTGLGNDKEGARIGAAILLRTFLHPGYEAFYIQTFDLAVGHLRLRNNNPHAAEPLDTLSQALITVFKEFFPLAHARSKAENVQFRPQSLIARSIQLDNAYLSGADLKQAWLPQAFLRNADLRGADLRGADLRDANLSGAILHEADLRGADLSGAILHGANLYKANLGSVTFDNAKLNNAALSEAKLHLATFSGAILHGAVFDRADLHKANLSGAFFNDRTIFCGADLSQTDLFGISLNGVDLRMADLRGADVNVTAFDGADLSGAKLNGITPQDARSFRNTNLRGVQGLTKEQLAICKAKGAIIDEDPTTSSSQSIIASSPASPSNGAQTLSDPSAQKSTPPTDPDGSNTTSSSLQDSEL
jgi:uncharacterized protein YjbI with pentapeptide repeats